MVGQVIGNYRVIRLLGEGGMGAVYEAVNDQIQRRAAIKVLHAGIAGDPQVAARFFNEARAVNIINHPGIVNVFEFGHLPDGTAYIVMDFLQGESLSSRIQKAGGSLGVDALRLARQISSALAAAHTKGIIHRDMKPDNVFIVPDAEAPGGERCKVLDFGIAKVADAASGEGPGALRTQTHMVMGTPTYMAPEQCMGAGQVTDKADVYALGVMLFQMLGGRLPFNAPNSVALMYAHMSETPPDLRQLDQSIPADLAQLVNAMLSKQPPGRPSMEQVMHELERLGANRTDSNRPALAMPIPPPGAQQPQPHVPTGQQQQQMPPRQPTGYSGQPQQGQPQPQAPTPSYPPTPSYAPPPAMGAAPPSGTAMVAPSSKGGSGGMLLAIILGVVVLVVGGGTFAVWKVMSSASDKISSLGKKIEGNNKHRNNIINGNNANIDDDDTTTNKPEDDNSGSGNTAGSDSPFCGPFAKMTPAPAVPRGFSIMACNESGGTASLVFKGEDGIGSMEPTCKALKSWASSAGWTTFTQSNASGTIAYIMNKGNKSMAIACTKSGGMPIVSMSMFPRH